MPSRPTCPCPGRAPARPTPQRPPRYLLSPAAYRDQAWFEREQRELFGRTWGLAAYETDLPEPGSYLPVQVGLEPVLLVRGPDVRVRGEAGSVLGAYRVRRQESAGGASSARPREERSWETVLTLGHEAAGLPLPPDEMPEPASGLVRVDGQPWHVLDAPAGLS